MPPLSPFRRHCLALAVSQALLIPAQAATIQVTSNADTDDGMNNQCTLREAIVSMNAGEAKSGCSNTGSDFGTSDSITFSTSLTSNTITLANSQLVISRNKAVSIDASNIDGGITVDANKQSRVFYVNAATLSLENMTITGGSISGSGGGLLANNSAVVSLSNSTVLGNSVGRHGGGLSAHVHSTISLSNSTVSGNLAGNSGGGLDAYSSSIVSLSNSTVSGNLTENNGGGLYTYKSSISLSNSTVSGNSAGIDGGGLYIYYSSSINLSNSIIANSEGSGGDCYNHNSSNFPSTISSDTATIIEDGSCRTSARSGDPGLLPLADNGGATKTHALRRNSIARNTGIDCTAEDQTGRARDTQCDVGAIEFNPNNEDGSFVIPLGNGKSAVIVL